jgi:hypothetical protein
VIPVLTIKKQSKKPVPIKNGLIFVLVNLKSGGRGTPGGAMRAPSADAAHAEQSKGGNQTPFARLWNRR